MYEIKRSSEEIDRVVGWAADAAAEGQSNYSGMSYEEGVQAAIDWLTGAIDEAPDQN